jgi:hypothetical protein
MDKRCTIFSRVISGARISAIGQPEKELKVQSRTQQDLEEKYEIKKI